jgi:predicted type IV restriction endonuclease
MSFSTVFQTLVEAENLEKMWFNPVTKGLEYAYKRGIEVGIKKVGNAWISPDGYEYELISVDERNERIHAKNKTIPADVIYGGKQRDGRGLGT